MSDITHSRRATEALDAFDASERHLPGEELIKAGVHASLAISRATRELDTTTRQVHRLTADSIDEFAVDMVRALQPLQRRPLLVKMGDTWFNPEHVVSVRAAKQENMSTIRMADGLTFLLVGDPDSIARRLFEAVA